jgi:hypothetical protein
MSSTVVSSFVNSTDVQENVLPSNTTPTSDNPNAYDHQGAAIYIAVILVWYSSGLAMMLFLQVRPRTLQQQFLLDPPDSTRKHRLQSSAKNPFTNYRNIQADNATKQILNELKDPEKRQRLWKIYFTSNEKQNEQDSRYYQTITSDGATINRIKRKLADIHRMDPTNEDSSIIPSNIPTNNENRPTVLSSFDSTKFFSKRFPLLRRPNGNTTASTNIRPPLVRVQSQNDATLASDKTLEMEPLVSTTNTSRKRNNLATNRFTIEKVSDNSTTPSTVTENFSE